MIRNGDVELQAREEEIRFLTMQKSEEKRSIGLLQNQLPGKKAQEQELVTLQIQVRVLYCLFILSAIYPYTTGLKALFNQSDCTGTAPTHK